MSLQIYQIYQKIMTQRALVIEQYGTLPTIKEWPVPKPKEGQMLVKVDASTVNPSDRGRLSGGYSPVSLPNVMGIEGTGRVVEANGENLQAWVGKRISFIAEDGGAWAEFILTSPGKAFVIDEDVPLHTAASGIVNPLTAVGMTEQFEANPHRKGIIHTAAASALGRMLNKRCIRLGIPLLNIVRREEHAALLKSEGAQHVIVTKGDWQKEYAEAIKTHGFNVLFDALGGGPVTEALILGLNSHSIAYIYGYLERKPLTITVGLNLSKGITITGYMLFAWYVTISAERRQHIRDSYSEWLKTELSTTSFKVLKFDNIAEALELSVSNATEGKVTIVPA